LMMVVVELSSFLLQMVISPQTKFGALAILIISVIVGMIVYGGITMKTKLADQFLGDIPNKLRRKLGIIK
ncbi:polysaccharide biosynthesis protein, partial [Staphylococcus ureilyticus]|nr:polysaccharide biosynthesis protein [Staphylococcus ureilyticus]